MLSTNPFIVLLRRALEANKFTDWYNIVARVAFINNNAWFRASGQTDPARKTPKKKRRGVQLQAGPHPSFCGAAHGRVCGQFRVHAAFGEPCMCMTMERASLLRPLVASAAG